MDELMAAILTQQANDRNFTNNALIANYEDTIGKLVTALSELVDDIESAYGAPYAANPAVLYGKSRTAAMLVDVYRDKIQSSYDY